MNNFLKNLPMLFFLVIATSAFAQKGKNVSYDVPELPKNDEGIITYTAIVEESALKDELYKRAMIFFNSYYKNPNGVLQKKDESAGVIEGVARFKIFNPADKNGVRGEAGLVSYNINIMLKDGRYKYEITRINWKQASFYGIEKWQDKSSPSYQVNYDYYLIQTDEQMKDIVEKLTVAMKQSTVVEKKSDW